MGIKTYSVTLEEEIVDKAKELYSKHGSKLSPLLNMLLDAWCVAETENNKKLKEVDNKKDG